MNRREREAVEDLRLTNEALEVGILEAWESSAKLQEANGALMEEAISLGVDLGRAKQAAAALAAQRVGKVDQKAYDATTARRLSAERDLVVARDLIAELEQGHACWKRAAASAAKELGALSKRGVELEAENGRLVAALDEQKDASDAWFGLFAGSAIIAVIATAILLLQVFR